MFSSGGGHQYVANQPVLCQPLCSTESSELSDIARGHWLHRPDVPIADACLPQQLVNFFVKSAANVAQQHRVQVPKHTQRCACTRQEACYLLSNAVQMCPSALGL